MEVQRFSNQNSFIADPWEGLKKFTRARIALGRSGIATPLKEVLDFKMCHAHARDAVYSILNIEEVRNELLQFNLPVIKIKSKAKDRATYLQRPDFGRKPGDDSLNELKEKKYERSDVAIVIADGLSAIAINEHVIEVLKRLIILLQKNNLSIAPLVIAEQARVAIADEIGFLLNAKLSLILIGERPGLSSPDSMGAYLTYDPRPGLTDEARNCVSNIRPEGLNYELAAEKIFRLIRTSMQLKISGLGLKDDDRLLK